VNEEELKALKASMKDVSDQLKAHAESAKKEIQLHQDLSKETKVKVDELLMKQGELQARLQMAEQIVAKVEAGGSKAGRQPTLGEQVTDSEEYKAWAPKASRGSKFTMPVNAAITSGDGSAGAAVSQPLRVPGVVTAPNQRLFVRDILSWGRTSSNAVEFVRETGFTNNADVVSENPASGKPESNLTFELDSASVATIAHWVRATKQVLSDAPMLQSYIDGRLRYGLKLKEEAQLLKGSGVGLNIHGIVPQASTYSNPGVSVTNETRIDRIRLAMLQAELAEYNVDGIVLHPVDWAAIELTKDGENNYIFANPHTMTTTMLWGKPVVPSQSMDIDEFLVGSFQQGAQGWDREDATLIVSLEDRDNVIKNLVTLLLEERAALTVYRPEAFVTGDFGFAT